ncbi:MAG: ABC transporter substrate-binding protein [Dehalococcoidia bacterium]|nr:ABC transporter substrate-binding protein [Dehalococcoidia bacterium]
MRRQHLAVIFGAIVSMAMVIAACGGGDDSAPSPAATAPLATAAARPTAAPTPTATPQPVPQGSLRIALGTVNFQSFSSKGGIDPVINEVIYDMIVGNKPDGTLNPAGGFATSWTANADSTAWTFKFKNNVVFQNGDKATSQDAKFTQEFQSREGFVSPFASIQRALLGVMETPDDLTMIANLKTRSIFFPISSLSALGTTGFHFLLPKAYITSLGAAAGPFAGAGEFEKRPLGSGPYKIREINPAASYAFEAVPNHWLYGVPKYRNIEFRGIPEQTTRIALLKTGDIEITEVDRAATVELPKAGLKVFTKEGSAGAYLNLHQQWITEQNGVKNPLAIRDVREALSLAIDRKALIDTFLFGQAKQSSARPLNSWDLAYKEFPPQAYDPARARQLLQQAGYPNGFSLEFWIFTFPGLPEGLEIMEAVAVSWERVGIKVQRRPSDFPTYQSVWNNQRLVPPAVGGVMYIPNRLIGSVFGVGCCTKAAASRVSEDPEIERLVAAWTGASTVEEYTKQAQALQQAALQQVIIPMLFDAGATYGAAASLPQNWQLGKAPYTINLPQLWTR